METLEQRNLLAGDLLFADSFEEGSTSSDWGGKWVQDSQNDWFRSTRRATDGNRSAEVDGFANNAALTMANPLDLTSYSSAQLTYSWFIQSNWDTGEYIALDVYDGGWQQVDVVRGNVDAENVWHDRTINLENYLNDEFRIRFRSKVSASNEDGNVDNVRITGVPITTNQAPVAEAGVDQNLSDAGGNGDEFVMLAGIASDSDGTIVAYEWRNGTTVLGTTANISTTLQVGTHMLTFIVTDNDGATATDTVVVTIDEVVEKPVKVFLLAGQSNMNGTARAEDLDAVWNVPQDDVWIWLDHNMDGGQWTTLAPGHGLTTHAPRPDEPEGLDVRNGLGPELSLGSILADAYPDHRVALIKHADGGRDVASHFNPENIGAPESGEHMWSGLLKKTEDAFAVLDASGYTYEVEGVFWAQGAGDARNRNSNSSDPAEVLAGAQEALSRSAQYGENLTRFITAVRDQYAENLPFVMARIDDSLSAELLEIYPGAELVRQAQIAVAASDPWTVAFAPEITSLSDLVHYDAAGQIEFGTKLADRYFNLVSPASQSPTASDDNYTTAEDNTLTVLTNGLLANDSDPENDALTAVLVSTTSHGALTLNADGSFSYSPTTNFFGTDSFTYLANDGSNDSNLATVAISVTPVNDAPVAAADNYAVDQDTTLSIVAQGVLSNDSDVEGDSLTAELSSTTTTHGGQVMLNNNGSFSYTPPAGFTGVDSFSYRAFDGSLSSDWATVSIEVQANDINAMYVYDIRFESRYWGWQRRAVFEVRWDSNGDGVGGATDARLAGVSIIVEFAGRTYTGTTDGNGIFRTSWIGNPGSGTYAEVVDMALADYVWNPLALDLEDDRDGDGRPDAQL